MNKKIIFNMEDRGSDFIFHWYILMLGALRRIPNNLVRAGLDSNPHLMIEQNLDEKDQYISNLKAPYFITCSKPTELRDFHIEALDIIKSDFIFIPKEQIKTDDIVITSYGEPVIPVANEGCTIDSELYFFLKNLFLKNIPNESEEFKNKKFYISRNKSHLLNGNSGIKRRNVVNNEELKSILSQNGFECIDLEDFKTVDKIKIFNQADTILSPNSGALTFSLFANSKTKIVEMNTQNPHMVDHLYQCMCSSCSIPYYKFYTDKIDHLDNMNVNIDNLLVFLKKNSII